MKHNTLPFPQIQSTLSKPYAERCGAGAAIRQNKEKRYSKISLDFLLSRETVK